MGALALVSTLGVASEQHYLGRYLPTDFYEVNPSVYFLAVSCVNRAAKESPLSLMRK